MNYLIAGLGNVGMEYEGTRHNIGFDVADYLAKEARTVFALNRLAFTASYKIKGRNIYLIKPTTFMNGSGRAVKYWLTELKIPTENLLIVLDDLALPFGVLRLRAKGSDGGHNGLKDIDAALGTNVYARLRIGIGNNFPKGAQVNYVLGKWSETERAILPEIIQKAGMAVHAFVLEGVANAMNKYNR